MPEHAAVTGHDALSDQYLARVHRLIARIAVEIVIPFTQVFSRK